MFELAHVSFAEPVYYQRHAYVQTVAVKIEDILRIAYHATESASRGYLDIFGVATARWADGGTNVGFHLGEFS